MLSANNLGAKGTPNNNKINGGAVHIKRKRENTDPQRRLGTPTNHAHANMAHKLPPDHEREISQGARRGQTAPVSGSSSRTTPMTEQVPPLRRKRGAAGGESSGPSLLSRLAIPADGSQRGSQPPSSSIPAKRRAEPDNTPVKRANMRPGEAATPPGGYSIKGANQTQRSNSQTAGIGPPAGGWSIKGAARRLTPPSDNQIQPAPSSLLERMKSNDGDFGGKNRKRRIKT